MVYEVKLWDWNDVWSTPEGDVIFRGMGQPEEYTCTAQDADRVTISIEGRVGEGEKGNVLLPPCTMVVYLGCCQFEPWGLEYAMQQ